MVKLTSFMAFSTLVIVPTFAAVLPNIETRDVAEPQFFGRDVGGLFAREQDFELSDLARRFLSGAEDNSELVRRDVVADEMSHVLAKKDVLHKPFSKHSLFLDPALDKPEPHIHDDIDDDLSERPYDDLDQ